MTFLSALKIIGIVIACILGLVLLFVTLLLTVPFRYTADLKYVDRRLRADAEVRWELRAVRFWYHQSEDGSHDGELLLFGIRLMRFNTDSGWLSQQIAALKKWAADVYQAVMEAPEGPLNRVQKIRRELSRGEWADWSGRILNHAKITVMEIFPKEGDGEILFGLEDAYLTGKVLEACALLYPLYGTVFDVCPDFNSKVFTADLQLKGRPRAGKTLYHAAMLLYGRESQMLYQEFMRLTHNE